MNSSIGQAMSSLCKQPFLPNGPVGRNESTQSCLFLFTFPSPHPEFSAPAHLGCVPQKSEYCSNHRTSSSTVGTSLQISPSTEREEHRTAKPRVETSFYQWTNNDTAALTANTCRPREWQCPVTHVSQQPLH